MFAKINRVHSVDFNKIKKSNKIQTEYLKCIYKNNENFQCSVVVSKKNNKKAVSRNLQKRRLIPIIKKNLPFNKRLYVFFILKNIQKLSFLELENEFLELINRIKK